MESRYFPRSELESCFRDWDLPGDLLSGQFIGIVSIADLVELCDLYKRNDDDAFLTNLQNFKELALQNGYVFLSELDQFKLSSALFDRDEVELTFWKDGADRSVPPLHSIRCLTLRVDESVFWDIDAYNAMLESLGVEV